MSIAGPAAQRTADVAGPDFGLIGQREEALVQRVEHLACTLLLLDRQVGASNIAHEQRVAGQHGPRLGSPLAVDDEERAVLRAVARNMHSAHVNAAQLERPAVVERLVVVVGGSQPVDVDRGAGGRGEPAVAGYVVGVGVGLEYVLDAHVEVAGQTEVVADLQARVDHRGQARVLVAYQV